MSIQNDAEKDEMTTGTEPSDEHSGGIIIEDGNEEPEAEKAEAGASENTAAAEGEEAGTSEAENAEPENEEASEDEAEKDGVEEDPEKKPKERKLNWAKKAGAKKETAEDKAKALLAEANDKYARLFAEFDNFRKRTDKEKAARYDMGARDTIEKILPVLDNFERGFETVEESDKEDAFVTGMDLVYKQFQKVLEDMGVKPIEAVGKEFDPELHNAVMHVDDPEAGENIVVEEFQKGYIYKDQVVRYSMVKVAN